MLVAGRPATTPNGGRLITTRWPCVRWSCAVVHPQGLDALELPRPQRFGYRIVNREVLFQGYCSDCGKPQAPEHSS